MYYSLFIWDLIKHSCFFGGEFLSILPYNNKNKNCRSSFHQISYPSDQYCGIIFNSIQELRSDISNLYKYVNVFMLRIICLLTMAMLTVYKKIFQHLLSSNLNEVYNFRLFASSNLPELICITAYSYGT